MSRVKKVFRTVAISCAVFVAFATILYRFENPKLTQTEIFINLWKLYAVVFMICLINSIISRVKDEE